MIGSISVVKYEDDGLWHALLYTNHPTPSGSDRLILSLSTTKGTNTAYEALELMKSGLKSDFYNSVDKPTIDPLTDLIENIHKSDDLE